MKRLVALFAAVVIAVFTLVAVAPSARADDDDTPKSWKVTKYHVTATPKPDGETRMVLDLDFDFANDPGHGPFVSLVTRMRVPNDPDHWRTLDVNLESVTSPSGANTATKVTRESSGQIIRIGTQGTRFRGVQSYRITYTVRGIVNPKAPGSGLDEFNWNVVFAEQVPINNLKVTVNGPADTTRTACYEGRSMTVACEASAAGSTRAEFSADRLTKGQGMQVVAGYPAGTFPGAKIQLDKRHHAGNMFPLAPLPLAAGGLTALVGALLVGRAVRRNGRDDVYAGLAPGMRPAKGQQATTAKAGRHEVPVAFSPPKGATPGEVGTIIDQSADVQDVTATILDLAVRGHYTIEPDPNRPQDFTLVRPQHGPNDQLRSYESKLMQRMFGRDYHVTSTDLKHKSNAPILKQGRTELDHRVVELKWFKTSPNTTRSLGLAGGLVLLVGGVGLSFVFGLVGFGWVGIGLAAVGLMLAALSGRLPARTAEGSAVLAQAQGFRTYLTTAEADQIRFEEGIDVFSRYLPYATVFGVADRWVRVFQELEAEGRYTPDTTWYGSGYFWGTSHAFGQSMNAVTASMTSSLNSAVASANASSGSGGGSGFSGGGGVGGGSVGGW